jgi:hypothetical protein
VPDFHLTIPHLQVTLDDGRVYRVQAMNPDLLMYDRTAVKHHWPDGSKAPFLWLTFLAWHASKRQGLIPDDWTWEQFSEVRAIEVMNVPDDDLEEGDGVVNPTLLEAVRG